MSSRFEQLSTLWGEDDGEPVDAAAAEDELHGLCSGCEVDMQAVDTWGSIAALQAGESWFGYAASVFTPLSREFIQGGDLKWMLGLNHWSLHWIHLIQKLFSNSGPFYHWIHHFIKFRGVYLLDSEVVKCQPEHRGAAGVPRGA